MERMPVQLLNFYSIFMSSRRPIFATLCNCEFLRHVFSHTFYIRYNNTLLHGGTNLRLNKLLLCLFIVIGQNGKCFITKKGTAHSRSTLWCLHSYAQLRDHILECRKNGNDQTFDKFMFHQLICGRNLICCRENYKYKIIDNLCLR